MAVRLSNVIWCLRGDDRFNFAIIDCKLGRVQMLTVTAMRRRCFMQHVVGGAAAAAVPGLARAGAASSLLPDDAQMQAIEAQFGGRLGVAVFDAEAGRQADWRGSARFALCSTFKMLVAAQILMRSAAGKDDMARQIEVAGVDVAGYAPVLKQHVGQQMSLAALCAAAVTYSDNAAANLLLQELGGPAGLTALLRAQGDQVTRLDRWEPDLNSVLPGDPRDTTTPLAMLAELRGLFLGDDLQVADRAALIGWMLDSQTGARRLRTGMPKGWRLADKTGSGSNGATADVGVLFPPVGAAILLAVYGADSAADLNRREAAFAALAAEITARSGR